MTSHTALGVLLWFWFCGVWPAMVGQLLRVGPGEELQAVSVTARKAKDGHVVREYVRPQQARTPSGPVRFPGALQGDV